MNKEKTMKNTQTKFIKKDPTKYYKNITLIQCSLKHNFSLINIISYMNKMK